MTYIPPPPPGLTLTTTRAASASGGVKCLVYGPAGVGKTRLCATAPKPLILSAEAGLMSLRDQDVPTIEITSVEQLNSLHAWLAGPGGSQFYTICLDSISEIAEKVLTNAKKKSKDGRAAYGTANDQMWEVIRAFRDLPGKCVVFTAKAEWVKDDTTGITRWSPSMPGKSLTQGLAYFFDEVFYMGTGVDDAGAQYRYLQTYTDLQYVAKDRSGSLDPMEYPDLTNIFNKIYGV